MRFTSAVVIAILGAAQASPILAPEPFVDTVAIDGPIEASAILSGGEEAAVDLDKRQAGISAIIIEAVGSAIATAAVDGAVKLVAKAISGLKNWDSARQEFTKQTTAQMWAKADKKAYSAAVCYNAGYDAPNIDGKTSVSLKSGLLKTNYDCFFMKAGANTFKGKGDGGFQNLAAQHDSRCTYNSKTITLSCK